MTTQEIKDYDIFLKVYCRPDNARFNKRRPIDNEDTINLMWERLLEDYKTVEPDAIKRYLCNKKYKTYYLITYWWYIISHRRKVMDGWKCTHKGCIVDKRQLQVHHKDVFGDGNYYVYKGEEISFMDALQTVCPACHREIHNIEEKKKRKGRKNKSVVIPRIDDFSVTSDQKKYVVTVKTHELSIEEIRAGIINNLDIVLDVLK